MAMEVVAVLFSVSLEHEADAGIQNLLAVRDLDSKPDVTNQFHSIVVLD